MKIIYKGGHNKYKTDHLLNDIFFKYSSHIKFEAMQNKKVAVIAYAKAQNFYTLIVNATFSNENIFLFDNPKKDEIKWHDFDYFIIPGGDTVRLKKYMDEKGFSIDKLKKDVTLIGNSAGAMVLGHSYYVDLADIDMELSDKKYTVGEKVTFEPGYIESSNLIIGSHIDNPVYFSESLDNQISEYAKKNKLNYIRLKENEEYTLELK